MVKFNKFFIPYIIFLMILGFRGNLLLSFILAIFHELVHYLVASHMGYKSLGIEILPIGASLNMENLEYASAKEDIIISTSAPLFNIVVGIFFCIIKINFSNNFVDLMIEGNLSLGLLNIIPAFPLDGGRVLKDILLKKKTYKNTGKIVAITSISISLMIASLNFYLLLSNKSRSINLILISIFIILASLKENERIPYIIMGDIVKKKARFLKSGYMENVIISVYSEMELLKALSLLEKNKYNIFTVLNIDMKLMDIIYEEEILNALKEYGNITFKELIDKKNENK